MRASRRLEGWLRREKNESRDSQDKMISQEKTARVVGLKAFFIKHSYTYRTFVTAYICVRIPENRCRIY